MYYRFTDYQNNSKTIPHPLRGSSLCTREPNDVVLREKSLCWREFFEFEVTQKLPLLGAFELETVRDSICT